MDQRLATSSTNAAASGFTCSCRWNWCIIYFSSSCQIDLILQQISAPLIYIQHSMLISYKCYSIVLAMLQWNLSNPVAFGLKTFGLVNITEVPACNSHYLLRAATRKTLPTWLCIYGDTSPQWKNYKSNCMHASIVAHRVFHFPLNAVRPWSSDKLIGLAFHSTCIAFWLWALIRVNSTVWPRLEHSNGTEMVFSRCQNWLHKLFWTTK